MRNHMKLLLFLSTLSLRRATYGQGLQGLNLYYFYPRSPCGERLRAAKHQNAVRVNFYPRSPCGERPENNSSMLCNVEFLSTLSLRRATRGASHATLHWCISIHALLAESDEQSSSYNAYLADFYPRSPCGERRRRSVKLFRQNYISIHALLAESDENIMLLFAIAKISIHALLAESDGQSMYHNTKF